MRAIEHCDGCGTARVETGAPIWETYCPNKSCTYDKDKMYAAISASLKASRDLKAEQERALEWCRANGNPHVAPPPKDIQG